MLPFSKLVTLTSALSLSNQIVCGTPFKYSNICFIASTILSAFLFLTSWTYDALECAKVNTKYLPYTFSPFSKKAQSPRSTWASPGLWSSGK